jgi:hypothetical protein
MPEQTKEPTQDLRGRFSCKPRCCEWCNGRGFKLMPLNRLYVKTSDMGEFFWWVHENCGKMIVEDERVLAWWNYGPYPLQLETT